MKQREDGAEGAGMGSSTAAGLNDTSQEELKSKHYLLTERGSALCGSNAQSEAWDVGEATVHASGRRNLPTGALLWLFPSV